MKTNVMVFALVVVLGAGTSGCGMSSRGGVPFGPGATDPPSPSTTCPFGFEGTRVEIEDTRNGVDLTLIAYGDVAELRRRARDAAAMYGPGAHRGLGHDGRHGNGQHHGLGLARLGVRVHATAQDTPEGACIHVAAVDAAEVERVRAALHDRADRARTGACP